MPYAWAPEPEDVKAQLPARAGGGPFTTTTTPTVDEVENLIGQVAAEIVLQTGTIPAELYDAAHRVGVLGTAYYIEFSLVPEQAADRGSPADRLYTEYQQALMNLRARLLEFNDVAGEGGNLGTIRTPSATSESALSVMLVGPDVLP